MSERTSITIRQSLRDFAESNLHSGPGAACQTESSYIMEQSLLHEDEELPKPLVLAPASPSRGLGACRGVRNWKVGEGQRLLRLQALSVPNLARHSHRSIDLSPQSSFPSLFN